MRAPFSLAAGLVLLLSLAVVLTLSAWPVATGGEGGGAATVAAVGSQPVTAADLAAFWFERYPEEYARTLRAHIDGRIAREGATRHGLFGPQQVLDAAVAREVEARRTQLERLYGEAVTLEDEVRRAYDLDLVTWRDQVLRARLHGQLLLERVVRWDSRRRHRVHVRVIVHPDRAGIADAARRLGAGADFGLTARQVSQDPTAQRSGELPLIARGDLAFPEVEARLFAAAPGALVGPMQVTVEGRPQWQLYKVLQQLPPWQVPEAERARRLESDLVAAPVDRGEYERWHARMVRERAVRFYRPDGRAWLPPTLR